jgi:hypothetical protein
LDELVLADVRNSPVKSPLWWQMAALHRARHRVSSQVLRNAIRKHAVMKLPMRS